MSRRQCRKCPWRVDVDPTDIDNYDRDMHEAMIDRLSHRGGFETVLHGLRIMACHESKEGAEFPCVGWMAHELGPGNNIGLRIAAAAGRIDTDFELVGDQHPSLESTLSDCTRRRPQ